jgi:hypothetical protein
MSEMLGGESMYMENARVATSSSTENFAALGDNPPLVTVFVADLHCRILYLRS